MIAILKDKQRHRRWYNWSVGAHYVYFLIRSSPKSNRLTSKPPPSHNSQISSSLVATRWSGFWYMSRIPSTIWCWFLTSCQREVHNCLLALLETLTVCPVNNVVHMAELSKCLSKTIIYHSSFIAAVPTLLKARSRVVSDEEVKVKEHCRQFIVLSTKNSPHPVSITFVERTQSPTHTSD